MMIFGILFILLGILISLAGLTFYVSDIQLGIGITGINMIGIGIILIGIANLQKKSESKDN